MIEAILNLSNNISALQLILLSVGLVLLIIEVFVPSFGIFGILGIALLIVSIFLTAKTVAEGILMFFIILIIAAVLFIIALRVATKGKLSKKLINIDTFSEQDGYVGVADMSAQKGLEGKSLTILRPAGKGDFDGRILDVVTKGEFIEKGKKIVVEDIDGMRIIVKEYKGG